MAGLERVERRLNSTWLALSIGIAIVGAIISGATACVNLQVRLSASELKVQQLSSQLADFKPLSERVNSIDVRSQRIDQKLSDLADYLERHH